MALGVHVSTAGAEGRLVNRERFGGMLKRKTTEKAIEIEINLLYA
jgi:hypothetical protein